MSTLANRYASIEMQELWSREFKITQERILWIAVLKAQKNAGLAIDDLVIADYQKVISKIDLKSIDSREKVTQHDVMARIEEFNALAGHQKIHIGMTSRDLTENVELYQLKLSLELVEKKTKSLVANLCAVIQKYSSTAIVARTHNVPAQITTLGRKFCIWTEELIFALSHLQELIKRLPLRGLKGAIGTSQDGQYLFGAEVDSIDSAISSHLGFKETLLVPSQIYPRSIDFEITSVLSQLASAPGNIAINIRLLSGFGLLRESFNQEQVGSSAMPHKVNPRLSERVNGLHAVLKGFVTMTQEMIGNQWNEGDVSCSVIRRVALPDSFFAIDAIIDTTIRIIQGLDVQESMIEKEVREQLPFLLSSKLLAAAIENGVGREDAHSRIKEISIKASQRLAQGLAHDFQEMISSDSLLGITAKKIAEISQISELISPAEKQSTAFLQRVRESIKDLPDPTLYKPSQSI